MPASKGRKPSKSTDNAKPSEGGERGSAIYHVMHMHEDFETTADILFQLVRDAAVEFPGRPRYLYLDIQGHRNEAGAFDHDAFELQQNFLLGYLGRYLTGIHTPLYQVTTEGPQDEELPDALAVAPGGDAGGRAERLQALVDSGHEVYDADTSAVVEAVQHDGGESASASGDGKARK